MNDNSSKQPIMMAMGDSLSQGCRSLSVTSRFCAQSYAANIARALGWDYVTANYPKPVLFDLENTLSGVDGFLLVGEAPFILQSIGNNSDFWASPTAEWASTETNAHDCVGITGAVLDDLITFDSNHYDGVIKSMAGRGALDLLETGDLSKLHIAITGRYALNPSNNPEFANLTQLGWVNRRKPKYLFVDSGHNSSDSGFFGTVFSGNPPVSPANPNGTGFNRSNYIANMTKLVDALLTLEKMPDQIFISLLPKPSAVPNMEPNWVPLKDIPYFDRYWPAFGVSNNEITGPAMQAIDESVLEANKQVASYISSKDTGNHFTVIDSYALLAKYDYKHAQYGLCPGIQIPVGGLNIDNNYVEGTADTSVQAPRGITIFKFLRGGFSSLDGCHPTAIGYAIYALEMLETMAARIGTPVLSTAQRQAIVTTALNNEDLVKPNMLRQVEMIRQYLNAFSSHKNPQATTSGANASTVAQVVEGTKEVFVARAA